MITLPEYYSHEGATWDVMETEVPTRTPVSLPARACSAEQWQNEQVNQSDRKTSQRETEKTSVCDLGTAIGELSWVVVAGIELGGC